MKKLLHTLTVLALLGSSILITPAAGAWSGANTAVNVVGGASKEQTIWMSTDSNGNVYTAGYFQATVDFDPGDGIANLTSAGLNDMFISKLDPSGNYLWAKRFGSTNSESIASIAVDKYGNIFATGDLVGTVDFDPGDGIANLTSVGGAVDGFVLKLKTNGDFVWAKSFGSPGFDKGVFIAVDGDGNVAITGTFSETVDFDPGAGVANLTATADWDIFILKLDSFGNYLWANRRGGTGREVGDGIAFDNSGNIYASGYFNGTVDFDPGEGVSNITSNGLSDVFISKFDPSGNYLWAKRIGGTSSDYINPIGIDSSGNIFMSGLFKTTVDFDPGAGTTNLTSAGGFDIFILKLDSSGNYLWAKGIGGLSDDQTWSIASDGNGNIVTTGKFAGTADFDPGAGTANLTSAGRNDIFIQKLDSSGNYLWAKQIGGPGDDSGQPIAFDSSGNVYVSGYFSNTVDFDPGAGTSNFTSNGDYDMFTLKLDSSGIAPSVAVVSAGLVANSKVATIPSGVTEAAIARTNELPAIKLNFGGTVPTAVTVAPVAVNPAPAAVTPFVLSPSTKIVDIQLSGPVSGSATICLDGSSTERLYHFTGGAWVQLGSQSYVNGQVCGVTTSFSPFTAAAPSPISTAPGSVIAIATGKRSATVSFTAPASDGGSAITSYTVTSTPGGITKTLTQATAGTFTLDGLQPETNYTFAVTATNANGTSAAATSNSVKTTAADVASISSITFTDDGTGAGGKLAWPGKNIDAVLYNGPTNSYPGAFNFGAFSSSWNGSIRNLTPETSYTVSIYAISVDGIGESKSLTFKTSAKTEVVKNLAYWNTWLTENTYFKGEATRLYGLLSKFNSLETSSIRSFIKVPISLASTVTATSLTPKSCSVVSTTAKVDAGMVKALTKDTCTISYTVSGPSKAPATLVRDFVFKKVG